MNPKVEKIGKIICYSFLGCIGGLITIPIIIVLLKPDETVRTANAKQVNINPPVAQQIPTIPKNAPEEKEWKPDLSKQTVTEKAKSEELRKYEELLKANSVIKDQEKIEAALQSIMKRWRGGDIQDVGISIVPILMEPFGVRAQIEYEFSGRKNWLLLKNIDLLKEIYSHPALQQINSCLILPKTTFIDKYGQEQVSQAAKIVLNRPIARKINWENITLAMFENILRTEGQLWLHPGL